MGWGMTELTQVTDDQVQKRCPSTTAALTSSDPVGSVIPDQESRHVAEYINWRPQAERSIVGFRGDRIARRGRTAGPLWQARSPGVRDGGTAWWRMRGNGAAAAARAVRRQR
jgi:hypothetical protein